jgi:hypothetical protein
MSCIVFDHSYHYILAVFEIPTRREIYVWATLQDIFVHGDNELAKSSSVGDILIVIYRSMIQTFPI